MVTAVLGRPIWLSTTASVWFVPTKTQVEASFLYMAALEFGIQWEVEPLQMNE